jgi:hypothetical protein
MKKQDYYVLKLMYDQSEKEITRLLKEIERLKIQLNLSSERKKHWKDKYRELIQYANF